MNKKTLNPLLENHRDFNNRRLRLESMIKAEVEVLVYEYIEKFGEAPKNTQVLQWMRRLKRSYHTKQVTRML